MPHVDIPQDLFQQIQQTLPTSGTVDGFVRAAIRDKLAWQERRDEFFRLTDETRRTMAEKGLSEEQVLVEFERRRRSNQAD